MLFIVVDEDSFQKVKIFEFRYRVWLQLMNLMQCSLQNKLIKKMLKLGWCCVIVILFLNFALIYNDKRDKFVSIDKYERELGAKQEKID